MVLGNKSVWKLFLIINYIFSLYDKKHNSAHNNQYRNNYASNNNPLVWWWIIIFYIDIIWRIYQTAWGIVLRIITTILVGCRIIMRGLTLRIITTIIVECRIIMRRHALYIIILRVVIMAIQIYSQTGSCVMGSIFTKHTATNTMSAAVSSLAPNSLMVFVFLAIFPSIISVKPQNR